MLVTKTPSYATREMKVELYEAMSAERPESREVERQLAEARRRFVELAERDSGDEG